MKILIVTATKYELEKLNNFNKNIFSNVDVEFINTGIGMVNTTYFLAKKIYFDKPNFILNIGICGSYNKKFDVGSVVSIENEKFGDFGIDDNGKFIELNMFNEKIESDNVNLFCENANIFDLPIAKGITVNTATGSSFLINKIKNNFNPDVESMEGAAVFYVCLINKILFAQVRSVSNIVEPRNKSNWNIDLAMSNLIVELPKIISVISNKITK